MEERWACQGEQRLEGVWAEKIGCKGLDCPENGPSQARILKKTKGLEFKQPCLLPKELDGGPRESSGSSQREHSH